ncbi:MAG TPA: GNAT family N-acetyltransferase [Terracidiphilus sp.]|jgi:RimJ/RimL family protein N-acetyltransferase
MTPEGRTNRLILRPLAREDAAQIQLIFPHWEVVRYLRNIVPWPYPPEGARQYIEEMALPAIARGEEWHWTLRLRHAPETIIGAIGLKPNDEDHRGFWLGLPWHGQGLMSEAAVWANDFWFEAQGFPLLRVSKAAGNAPSRRISERQGMRLVGTHAKDYVAGRLPSETWEITAGEWRAWKAAQAGSRATTMPSNRDGLAPG